MGLGIWEAAKSSFGGQLGDQYLEFFYCDSLSNDVLMAKGKKRLSKNSKNKNGEDNIITNGSVITVNEGQCMIIVDQGQIVEFCAQAGEFVYDASKEPSLLYGKLGDNVGKSVNTYLRRLQFGGDTGRDQRVYYFNLKEIYGNPFGTPSPIPFRIVDPNLNLDMDTTVRCHGEYSFKIVDPILFYKNVAGNQPDRYTKDLIIDYMKKEVAASLAPALAEISAMGIRYNEVSKFPKEIGEALNKQLTAEWVEKRGIAIVDVALNTPRLSDEDEQMIKQLQRDAIYQNPAMAAAMLAQRQGQAMVDAANNKSTGPMMAFAGMNMAQMTGGMDHNQLFAMAQQNQQNQNPQMAQAVPQQNMAFGGMAQQAPQQAAPQQQAAPVAGWTCTCGATGNTGKFCMECGAKRVEPAVGWTCSCGAVNTGKFCVECGTKKPADAPLYKCDKCGWEPEDPKNPPKFCPECGDPFDDGDIQ